MEVFQMKNNRGFIVGMRNEHIKKLIESISLKAFADEGEDGGEGEPGKITPSINYEDLIAKARREEKDKHYKTIEKLKTQVSTLTEQHNNDLLKIADLLEVDIRELITREYKPFLLSQQEENASNI